MKILLLLALSFALMTQVKGADYYVSTSGSDANPGTQALPWQTISKVNSTTFGAGDRIFFQGVKLLQDP